MKLNKSMLRMLQSASKGGEIQAMPGSKGIARLTESKLIEAGLAQRMPVNHSLWVTAAGHTAVHAAHGIVPDYVGCYICRAKQNVPEFMAKENSYKLLGIVQSHAPSFNEQCLVATMYNEMPAEGKEQAMAGMLYDGLAYGNWPWSETSLSGRLKHA